MVTQLQFNRIYQDKLDEAADRAYTQSVVTYQNCKDSIGIRDTYRGIFGGIEVMFQNTADLPVELFPDSTIAIAYQEKLTEDIQEYISMPVDEALPVKTMDDCPPEPISQERP